MKTFVLLLPALIGGTISSLTVHKRWIDGDSPTGTTDPDVASDCTYWANDISSNDTCSTLESYFGITFAQLHAWNPSLLEDWCVLIEGWSYCVEGPAVTTTATTATTATTTSESSTTGTATTITTTTTGNVPSPTQSGLISTCDAYYEVQSSDTCYSIQDIYRNFTLSEFYSWNPSITTGCNGLQAGYYVCVGVVQASSSSSLSATSTTATSSPPYSPQETGTAANCDEYYLVKSGDSCSAILSEYNITLAQFYSWNPSVGSDCTTMLSGYYYCVGVSVSSSSTSSLSTSTISATTTTSTASTTTTTTTSATATGPSPTQSGITTDCVTFYQVQDGDSCWSIVNEKYRYLTEDEFISWNPAVGSNCTLWSGYYYCVATKSVQPMPDIISTCATYYLVKDGDSCWSIEQSYSVSATNFTTWNPDVGSNCTSLWDGYYVCVGI